MSEPEPYEQLQMIWPAYLLGAPPAPRLPAGYHLRGYRAGDEPRFCELMALAGWPGWDAERLRPWLARIIPGGWMLAVHTASETIVATAMALHDHSDQHPFGGELGWVAADPAHHGWGLGQAVSAAVTARLIAAGYRNIHLYTEHWRLAALKSYLRLGYAPLLHTPAMPARWEAICAQLGWPFRPAEWRLAGGALHIRPFQPADEPAVVELWRRCGLTRPWNDPHKDIRRKLAFQPELFLVGLRDQALVATAMVGYEGHRGWVNYLAVAPAGQRGGLGRAMMAAVEQRLRALGCAKINLQVRADNHAAIGFYQQLGYQQDAVLSMGKRLEHDDEARAG